MINIAAFFKGSDLLHHFIASFYILMTSANYPNVMNVENEIHLPQTLQLEKSLNRITVAGL